MDAPRSMGRGAVAVFVALAAAAGLLVGTASAQISWRPCPAARQWGCARVAVPLDPSGTVQGTVSLAVRRKRAADRTGSVAVVGLAGGPGQAAIPLAQGMADLLGPAILTHDDLIVFDQRGTGSSDPLSCHALQSAAISAKAIPGVLADCAAQLGSAEPFYSTADSVADIEHIREDGGYSKLILYGTSYGTWVAMAYARTYPQYTARLVLDSTVAPGGLDPFEASTFAAIPHVLANLCSGGACAHITPNADADLALLARRLRRAPLRAVVFAGRGSWTQLSIGQADLLLVLMTGDLDPSMRADLPAAVRSALEGDSAPLGSLVARTLGAASATAPGLDATEHFATACEDGPFPWQSFASPAARLAEFRAALDELPASSFAPFDASTVASAGDATACSAWPNAAGTPAMALPALPDVPTIVFSGAEDLRTPTANARAVAAAIPDAHVVVVGHDGHSVLGTDSSGCAERALRAFFRSRPLPSCSDAAGPGFIAPTLVAPTSIDQLADAAGVGGLPGRTLKAVQMSLVRVSQQLVAQLYEADPTRLAAQGGSDVAGLRGGWLAIHLGRSGVSLRLHAYSYVPGVTLSGSVARGGTLVVSGQAAAHLALRVTALNRLTATVRGRSVTVTFDSPLAAELALGLVLKSEVGG